MTFAEIERGAVNRAVECEVLPSGKGVNCARAAVRLGADALALLLLGGATGEWMAAELASEGIRVAAVQSPAPTRTCTTLVERESGVVTELIESGGAVDRGTLDAFAAAFRARAADAEIVIITGTLPAGADDDLYARLLESVPDCAARTIVDSQGEALLAALAQRPLLAKPNRHEIAAATRMETDTDGGLRAAIRALHAAGAVHVLVSDGLRPAWFSDGESVSLVHPPPTPAPNPIGSGDCLAAGIAAGLMRGMPMLDAVRLGIACGTANASGQGYARFDSRAAEELVPLVRVDFAAA